MKASRPGDSGGPLIVDHAFSAPTIAAVLSGGDRFFNAQKSSSYGTTSFYQPLYLYWDWIIANNPYKYVGSKAGDGLWTDVTHWQMNLDPAYLTINGSNQLVNSTLPSLYAAQASPTFTAGFGLVCYYDDCINIQDGRAHQSAGPGSQSGGCLAGRFGQYLQMAGTTLAHMLGSKAGLETLFLDGFIASQSSSCAGGRRVSASGSRGQRWLRGQKLSGRGWSAARRQSDPVLPSSPAPNRAGSAEAHLPGGRRAGQGARPAIRAAGAPISKNRHDRHARPGATTT